MNAPTIADVAAHLNLASSTTDYGEVVGKLNAARGIVEGMVGPLEPASRVKVIPHGGGPLVALPSRVGGAPALPVLTLTDVRSFGTSDAPTVFPVASFVVEPGGSLTWIGTPRLPVGWLQVSWTAGRAAGELPPELHQAVLEQTRHLWETQRGGLASRAGTEGGGMGARGFTVPNRVLQLVEGHRLLPSGVVA